MNKILWFLLLIIPLYAYSDGDKETIRIITLNVWSGLDYEGSWKMGEYESEETRHKRSEILINQLKALSPDIIFLQEVNPSASFSGRIADELGYNEIHQVCNAGIKIGPWGIPSNLKEGNTILARCGYNLEEVDILKLSGSFGLHGDAISIHFDDAIFAQIAKVEVKGREIFLVNTHLSSESDSAGSVKRTEEIKQILDYIKNNLAGKPLIFGGDLNVPPRSPEINLLESEGDLTDCFTDSISGFTWDPVNNTNVHYSLNVNSNNSAALKEAEYDSHSRRIDYIFINKSFSSSSIRNSKIVFDEPVDSLYASDHYGLLADIEIDSLKVTDINANKSDWDALPIASYDTDFGFGAGFKAFLLSQLGYRESMDFTLYYSTKGERWYRFVFSIPDFELRQRTEYPAALDIIFDYDRMNQNSFFGIGNDSDFDHREYYTREPLEIKLQYSNGLSPTLVLQSGLKYKYVNNFNFEDSSKLMDLGGLSASKSYYYGIYAGLRFDSRNSFINPSHGVVLEGEFEYAPELSFNNVSFERISLNAQYFTRLFYPETIFASRILFQGLIGKDIPVQNLLSIGGNNTLRGFPQDRFMDKVAVLVNTELRFPIFWRFGGVLGLDAGNVWHEPGLMNFKDWMISPSAGLRFYFDTFIVRLDLGFSSETTGFYLNFGHIF